MGNILETDLSHYDELTQKNLVKQYQTISDPYSKEVVHYNHFQEVMKYKYLSSDCNLVCYQISSYEIDFMSKAISLNTSIVILELSQVNMTDDQLIYLIDRGLMNSATIRHLLFNHNRISCFGVIHLCQFLCKNDRITKLNLSFNFIGSLGFKEIGLMLKNNAMLNHLNLYGNLQTFEDNRRLNGCLKNNYSILYFWNKFFFFREILYIKGIIERNISQTKIT